MKNARVLGGLVVSILVLGAAGVQVARAAAPITACVNPGGTSGCFSSIQSAILSVPGRPGASITIADGTYKENIGIAQGQQIMLTGDTMNPGAVVIDGQNLGSTITLSKNASAIISSVTIINGKSSQGGAINSGGNLALEASSIANSSATGNGGCIFQGKTGQLLLIISKVDGCSSGSGGGAVYFQSNSGLTISASFIGDSTSASGDGGGLQIATGTAQITNTTFFQNSAQNGGGVALEKGKITGFNDTFDGNSATGSGGGLFQASTGGTIKLNNSSFGGNSANANGGAIDSSGKKNTVAISNTILGADMAGTGPECAGILKSNGWNLIFNIAGCTLSGKTSTNITSKSPMFEAALQCIGNEGLNTPCALPIQAGSPAVSFGNPAKPVVNSFGAACASIDAIGTARPKGSCDIGAFQIP